MEGESQAEVLENDDNGNADNAETMGEAHCADLFTNTGSKAIQAGEHLGGMNVLIFCYLSLTMRQQ